GSAGSLTQQAANSTFPSARRILPATAAACSLSAPLSSKFNAERVSR
uniref:Uncharacterized protein n=1 Tax=Aegilops tauschii subsp. strangulata TaxID=200361 RepID=A0A453PD63_AEGTS